MLHDKSLIANYIIDLRMPPFSASADFLLISQFWSTVMRSMRDDRLRKSYEQKKIPKNEIARPRNSSMASIVVAAVSFVISIVSFYNSSLRQVDNVSVVLESNGRVSDERWTDSQPGPAVKPQIHSGQDLIFINGGTRPLAVVELTIAVTLLNDHVEHGDEDDRITCNGAVEGTFLPTSFEPFVIKAGEIIPKHLQFRVNGAFKDTVRLPDALMPSDTQAIRVCFRFGFATPDGGYEEVVLKRPPFHLTGTQNFWDSTMLDKVGHIPRRIVYRNRTTVQWLNQLLAWVG